MTVLIFPGRHLLHTKFQAQYLRSVLATAPDQWKLAGPTHTHLAHPLSTLVFAVTSANHQFTRYNPLPFHVRAIGVDRFAQHVRQHFDLRVRIYGIPHYSPTTRFAEFLLHEIEQQTEGEMPIGPGEALILSSTAPLIDQFHALGYAVLPAEHDDPAQALTPQQLMTRVMISGHGWERDPLIQAQMHPVTFSLWRDFPEALRRAIRLWQDPLLNDEGSLTETRNYSTYAHAMSNEVIIDLKYTDIARHIMPGRIVDEGCADGALLARIARDYPDSDLIGIDIAGEMISRSLERQRAGEFGEAFIHFHHRNILAPLFRPDSIHTTICNSILHELWSYNEGLVTIFQYLHEKLRQLAPGGRLIIRDVVGVDDADDEILLWLDPNDGQEFSQATPPSALSTFARYQRFLYDFLPQRRTHGSPTYADYVTTTLDDKTYVVTSHRTAIEYLSKKDYTDNWESEMQEEFAFWNFADWSNALTVVGFQVLINPTDPKSGSHVYTNQWIVEQRWAGKASIFRRSQEGITPLPFPPTTMVLVGAKPR